MKLLVLHGPGISSSRRKLLDLKQKFDPNNVVIFEKGSSAQDILGALQTVPMFEEERLIIAENPPENFDIDYTLYPIPYTLILWFDHEIKTKYDGDTYFFPEAKETSVFPFLDLLGQRSKNAFLELSKLKKDYDTQYFITMIFYLLRNLVSTSKNAHEFVKKKNAKMRQNFSTDELINLYKFVLEVDFKIKKGLLDTEQAEFLLVNKFVAIP